MYLENPLLSAISRLLIETSYLEYENENKKIIKTISNDNGTIIIYDSGNGLIVKNYNI